MTLERRISLRKSVPVVLVGLAIFVFYLYFFVGIPEIISIIRTIDLTFYSLAVAALFADTLCYALAWQYFLRPLSIKVRFRKTFLYVWIGIFVDLLVPAESISGEVSKAYLMTKNSGENTGKVVASIVSHRILGMIITLLSLIVGSISFVILRYRLPTEIFNLVLLVASGTAISLVFLFLVCFREQLTWKMINSVLNLVRFLSRGRVNTESWRVKAESALRIFRESIETLGKNPTSLVRPVMFSLIAWLLSVLVSFFVFIALRHPVSLTIVVIVYSISSALQSVPLGIPAEVGLMEIVMTTLYSLFGVPIGISAAATVLIRVLTVWLRMLVGFLAVQWIGIRTVMSSQKLAD
jgi:uncharacterized protein (TIRG00374 family)